MAKTYTTNSATSTQSPGRGYGRALKVPMATTPPCHCRPVQRKPLSKMRDRSGKLLVFDSRTPYSDEVVDGRASQKTPKSWARAQETLETRLPSALFPSTGVVRTNTFQIHGAAKSGLTVQYLVNEVFSKLFDSLVAERTQDWIQLFCHDTLVYHALFLAVAVHQDLLSGQYKHSCQPEVLASKGAALRLVRERLSTPNYGLDHIEPLLAAMITLGGHDLTDDALFRTSSFVFEPYVPDANWRNVYGRLGQVEQHTRAVFLIVEQLGGIHKIRLPGLVVLIAHTDILFASGSLTHPSFPWPFDMDESIFATHHTLRTESGNSPGKGFFENVLLMPEDAISLFVRVATLDRYMAVNVRQAMTKQETEIMLETRNSLHHALLCLPAMHIREDSQDHTLQNSLYELTRTATIIYSTAVLVGLPTSHGWHLVPTKRLRRILEGLSLSPTCDLLIWILCVGALASIGSPDRIFFRERLKAALGEKGLLPSWSGVENILSNYLWSRMACGKGAVMLWNDIHSMDSG